MTNKLKVEKTVERGNVEGDFIAQMHPSDCGNHSNSSKKMCVEIKNKTGESEFLITAFLNQSLEVKTGCIGLDQKLRTAIGVIPKDDVQVKIIEPPKNFITRKILNKIWGVQCNLARVMFAGNTDMEINVSRVQKDVMGTIGVNEGDVVVVESESSVLEIRLLELTEVIKKEVENKIKVRPEDIERYNNLRLFRLEAELDIPVIALDYDARKLLHIEPGDAVRVYRSIKHSIMQKIHLVSTPLLITLIGSIVLIDSLPLRIFLGVLFSLVFLLNFIELKIKTR